MYTVFEAVANRVVKNNTKNTPCRTMMIIYGQFIYFVLYLELRLWQLGVLSRGAQYA